MGFRNGAYAKVWEVNGKTPNVTSVKISVSLKNKETGEYDTKFSEYASFLGAQCAKNALMLKPGDRIKLGEVDVDSSKWDPEKKTKYYSWKVFSFEKQVDGAPNGGGYPQNTAPMNQAAPANPMYEGANVEGDDEGLPF